MRVKQKAQSAGRNVKSAFKNQTFEKLLKTAKKEIVYVEKICRYLTLCFRYRYGTYIDSYKFFFAKKRLKEIHITQKVGRAQAKAPGALTTF